VIRQGNGGLAQSDGPSIRTWRRSAITVMLPTTGGSINPTTQRHRLLRPG